MYLLLLHLTSLQYNPCALEKNRSSIDLTLQLKGALTNPGIFLVLKYTGSIAQRGPMTEETAFALTCCSQTRLTGFLGTHVDI